MLNFENFYSDFFLFVLFIELSQNAKMEKLADITIFLGGLINDGLYWIIFFLFFITSNFTRSLKIQYKPKVPYFKS